LQRLKKKKEKDLADKLKDYDGDPDAMAAGGLAGALAKLKKKYGKDIIGRRNFMKLMAGLASLPFVGKLFKGSKLAKTVVPLQNTTTSMPAWFPDFVDKITYSGVGKKIDADLMEYKVKELPGITVTKHDDGRSIC
jgi:hypothetical protein